MKVRELIQELQKYDENDDVELGCGDDYAELKIGNYRTNIINGRDYSFFVSQYVITF